MIIIFVILLHQAYCNYKNYKYDYKCYGFNSYKWDVTINRLSFRLNQQLIRENILQYQYNVIKMGGGRAGEFVSYLC